jgi:hypothetical protein
VPKVLVVAIASLVLGGVTGAVETATLPVAGAVAVAVAGSITDLELLLPTLLFLVC